ncbi:MULTISPECIES: polyprenol phosphomannose-dependent alpha 1,6 mannosyltransferase MptB [unclassified Micromonospora]|uniref:polyprenol phosphomannose-dependent alpha 1,6 mannosyltransferase MptB n=1 Tax=unclassified Micromonospora TaxID=2617518 RepID=UPI001B375CC4|nr:MULTISPECIES: polyprenol phosphomannose-dependent alpha 1,6 mannosyltransferase MptB [unclassified Micromonospora]MBQ1039966.1 polyprenol phosphomannose-dependent alpha 1,6 mannosyltransferase MptB [Micromonospora sp. C81]
MSARLARYAGLAGAVLLTVAGYLGGALPDAPLGVTPVSTWRTPDGPATLICWLAGTTLLVGAWWSLRGGAPSTRWAYVTAGLWALPLLVAPPLGSRDVYSYACQGWTYAHGVDPYAVGVAAAGCPWLDTVAPIWRDTPAPYGPVFVLLAALAVTLGGGLTGTVVLLRVIAVAGLLLAAISLPGLARAAGVPTRRAAWLALAAPLVGVHLIAGAHNDAVMLGLLLCGLLVAIRRPGWPPALLLAGALLGLAVTVKASAVVVVPFAALAAVRGRHTVRALLRDGGWLAGGLLGAVLVTSAVSGLGFGWVGGLTHSGDSEQWTSPPTAVGFVVDYAGALVGRDPQAVPVVRAVALLLLAGVLVVLWWRAWRALRGFSDARRVARVEGARVDGARVDGARVEGARVDVARVEGARVDGARVEVAWVDGAWVEEARVEEARPRVVLHGAALALVATVVLSPVFHPWYATWPLALLALTAARTTWFVLPVAVAAFLTLPDGTNLARFTKAPGALAMTALLLIVVLLVLRTTHRPGPTRRS